MLVSGSTAWALTISNLADVLDGLRKRKVGLRSLEERLDTTIVGGQQLFDAIATLTTLASGAYTYEDLAGGGELREPRPGIVVGGRPARRGRVVMSAP